MLHSKLIRSAAAVAAFTLMAVPAFGAEILSVSWDITGGTFQTTTANPDANHGPITGGFLNYTKGAYSTGDFSLFLTGPSGAIGPMVLWSGGANLSRSYVRGAAASFANTGGGPYRPRDRQGMDVPFGTILLIGRGGLGPNNASLQVVYYDIVPQPNTSPNSYRRTRTTNFTLGNEVLVLVPEPSIATQLTVGLALLVGGPIGAARVWRRRGH